MPRLRPHISNGTGILRSTYPRTTEQKQPALSACPPPVTDGHIHNHCLSAVPLLYHLKFTPLPETEVNFQETENIMKKEELGILDIVVETLTVIAVLAFFGLQIYYRVIYRTGWKTMVYHLLPVVLIYIGTLVLQAFPELLNGINSEPLQGKVRTCAVRMVRNSKLFLIVGMLIPGIGDVLGMEIDPAYSLLVMACILGVIGYYLYQIYRYNKEKNHKGR